MNCDKKYITLEDADLYICPILLLFTIACFMITFDVFTPAIDVSEK